MWTRLGALAVVVAVLLAWWWWRPQERPRAERTREVVTEAPARRASRDARDESPSSEVEEPLPPDDPVERGPCALGVRVLDEVTGRPVGSEVRLWRLDAPRGGQLQAKVFVEESGATIGQLPAGRYRTVCAAQLRGLDAPPAFLVSGDRTDVELRIRLPRDFTVRLRVVDENGRPVTIGRLAEWTTRTVPDMTPPTWVTPRRSGASSPRRSVELETEYEVLDRPAPVEGNTYRLGTMRQDNRYSLRSREYVLGFPHGASVTVSVDGTIDANRTYLAVTVPLARLLECVRLADGGEPKGIRIHGTCQAVEETRVAWIELSVDVTAHLDGYESLSFLYRVAGPNHIRTLQPK